MSLDKLLDSLFDDDEEDLPPAREAILTSDLDVRHRVWTSFLRWRPLILVLMMRVCVQTLSACCTVQDDPAAAPKPSSDAPPSREPDDEEGQYLRGPQDIPVRKRRSRSAGLPFEEPQRRECTPYVRCVPSESTATMLHKARAHNPYTSTVATRSIYWPLTRLPC